MSVTVQTTRAEVNKQSGQKKLARAAQGLASRAQAGDPRAKRAARRILARAARCLERGRCPSRLKLLAGALHRSLSQGTRAGSLSQVGATSDFKAALAAMSPRQLKMLAALRAIRRRYGIRARR